MSPSRADRARPASTRGDAAASKTPRPLLLCSVARRSRVNLVAAAGSVQDGHSGASAFASARETWIHRTLTPSASRPRSWSGRRRRDHTRAGPCSWLRGPRGVPAETTTRMASVIRLGGRAVFRSGGERYMARRPSGCRGCIPIPDDYVRTVHASGQSPARRRRLVVLQDRSSPAEHPRTSRTCRAPSRSALRRRAVSRLAHVAAILPERSVRVERPATSSS